MNFKPAWAFALSTFIAAGTARAQATPPAWYPPQYLAHVSIVAGPATELEVVPTGGSADSPPLARCTEYCDFWALPGKYTLYARDHSGAQAQALPLRIKQSARFEFERGDDDARTTGLAVGVVGSAALLTGLILIATAALSSICEDSNCTSSGKRDAATVGLGLLVAGAIATPVGWATYAGNRTRLKRIDDGLRGTTEPGRPLRVGLVGVGKGGLGVGGLVTF